MMMVILKYLKKMKILLMVRIVCERERGGDEKDLRL